MFSAIPTAFVLITVRASATAPPAAGKGAFAISDAPLAAEPPLPAGEVAQILCARDRRRFVTSKAPEHKTSGGIMAA